MTSSGQDSASTFRPTASTTQLGVNEFRPTGRGVNHKDGNGHLQECPLGLTQRFVEDELKGEIVANGPIIVQMDWKTLLDFFSDTPVDRQ